MAKRNNGIKRELSRYIRKLNAPIPVSKVMAQVKAEYPELLYGVETKKEKREAMKNFYEVIGKLRTLRKQKYWLTEFLRILIPRRHY